MSKNQGGDSSDDDNVVFLKFKSPHVVEDMCAFIACRHCRNKTYTLVEDRVGSFPMMKCAACGAHIGRMGWASDDDPLLQDDKSKD
jgi:hypothetical protein